MSSDDGNGDSRDPRDQQGSGGEDEDKVIRLPRDWLGPRDELVPFGPSAERGDDESSEERSKAGDDAPDDDATARPPLEEVPPTPEPISPHDFWGERSAALQGPLDEAEQDAARDDESVATRRSRRVPVLAAAAAAAVVAVVILSISLLGQSSRPGRSRGSARADTSGGRGTLWPLPSQIAPAPNRGAGSGHRRPRRNRPSLAHSSASIAVNLVRQPPSQGAAGRGGGAGGAAGGGGGGAGAGSSSAAPSGASPPPFGVAASGNSSGSGSSTTASSSQSASTTPTSSSSTRQSKTPAFGPSGALGPGHSPTG